MVDFGHIRADFEHFLAAFISGGLSLTDQIPSRLRIICRSVLTWSQIFAFISLLGHKYLPIYILTWSYTKNILLPAYTQDQSKQKTLFHNSQDQLKQVQIFAEGC